MESKTPKFDAALDVILSALVPQIFACIQCKSDFVLTLEDIGFLKMLRVSPPTHCPKCRHIRRLAFANYSNIYRRPCNVPGHSESIISLVAPVIPWVMYDYETYYSDAWDPFSYGQDINSQNSFFGQFRELLLKVPQPGVRRGSDSFGSDYAFYGKSMKDCYYVFGGRRSEDVMFGSSVFDSQHVVDVYDTHNVENSYENISTHYCNRCFFTYFSSHCIDCDFMYDCHNCTQCFGCVNLRHKSYCWFNEQLTKEEFIKRKSQINLGSRTALQEIQKKFHAYVKENPIRAQRIVGSENIFGSDVASSKNCFDVFQISDSENLRYAYFSIMNTKDSMDVGFGGRAEQLYETQNTGTNAFRVFFSYGVKESTYSEYLVFCNNCTCCFGCLGLQNASYCIFNKQYTKEEYFKKIDDIKTEMLHSGEYGEFFDMSLAPYAYNSSLAHLFSPLTKEQAKARGLYWQDDVTVDTTTIELLSQEDIPDNIHDVPDDIVSKAIVGATSQKPFRIIARELDFYKKHSIALPTDTPYQRIVDRFAFIDFNLVSDNCSSCGENIFTTHATHDGFLPHCLTCYKDKIL